jgi:hypothetical protein
MQKALLSGGFLEMKKVILFILISIFAILVLNFFSANSETQEQQNLFSVTIRDTD